MARNRKLQNRIGTQHITDEAEASIAAQATITDEQIEDVVGGMLDGTETFIAVSYDDTDGNLDFVVATKDEDNMASNSSTHLPTQQSVKTYVDAEVAGIVDSAPAALNTLNELAAALGDDANYATTTTTALGNRLRVDTASQGLSSTQQSNALTNLGITASKAEINILDNGLSAGDIPSLATSKITSGTFSTAFIADDAITAGKLAVSGNGSTAQFLRSDGDGSFSWAVPVDTTYSVGDGGLTQRNFTSTLKDKLDSVAMNANNYSLSSDLLDEDNMASNSATKVATQQSIKAYVDAEVAGVVDSAPSALNTLNELAAALGDDANYATTTSTALGNRLRVDTASQGLNGTQQSNARTNLGLGTAATLSGTGAVANGNAGLVTGDTVYDYIAAQGTFGGLSAVVGDTTPELGGDLDVQARKIYTSTSNGDITLEPKDKVIVKTGTSGNDGYLQILGDGNNADAKLRFTNGTYGCNIILVRTQPNTLKIEGSSSFKFDCRTSTSGMTFPDGTTQNTAATSLTLLDEDNMATNSATAAASQQSIKAYVDAEVAGIVDSAPSALNTLNELAAALGDDANYAATTTTALGQKLVKASNLSDLTNAGTARTNLGLGAAAVKAVATDGAGGVADGEAGLVTGNAVYDYVAANGGDSNAGAANGSASAPAFSFSGDNDTGMYYKSNNTLGFATGGTFRMSIDNNGHLLGLNNLHIAGWGSYSYPAITMGGDTDTGIGADGANGLFIGTGGSPRVKIQGDVVDFVNSKIKLGGSYGSDGQVLTSTGSGVAWENASGGISDIVSDTSPQLGGNLDTQGYYIQSSTSNKTVIKPGAGSGNPQVSIGDDSNNPGILRVGSNGVDNALPLAVSVKNSSNSAQQTAAYFLAGNQHSSARAAGFGPKIEFRASSGTQYSGQVSATIGTKQIGTGESANHDLHLDAGGTGKIRFNDEFSFPAADGSSGQVLQTDGSGTLSWATAGGGDSWGTAVDAHIIPDTDNAYDLGSSSAEFRNGYFDGTLYCDGIDLQGNITAPNSDITITGGGPQADRAHIKLPNATTGTLQIMGNSLQNSNIDIDTRYSSGTGQIRLKTKGSTRFAVGADGELLIGGSAAGSSGQVLTSGGSGSAPSWATPSGSPGGSDTQLQYNNGGAFGGITGVTYDDSNGRLFLDSTRVVIGGSANYANGLTVNDEAQMRNTVKFADGSASAPSITRWNNGDDNTGIYFVNPDVIGFTTGGTSRMTIAADGTVNITGSLTVQGSSVGGASALTDLSDALVENNSVWVGSPPSATNGASDNTAIGKGALDSLTTGDYNTAVGRHALSAVTSGNYNVALGWYAASEHSTSTEGIVAIGHSAGKTSTANGNVLVGHRALENDSSGGSNIVIGHWAAQQTENMWTSVYLGYFAGYGNSSTSNTGDSNIGIGYEAHRNHTTGSSNIAIGKASLKQATTGTRNIAIGEGALEMPNTENDNLAIGIDAMGGGVSGGEYNVSVGNYSGGANALNNLSADESVFVGYKAGNKVESGGYSTMIGAYAGQEVTTGNSHVLIGREAGQKLTTSSGVVAIGYNSGRFATGANNTFVGYGAGKRGTEGSSQSNTVVGYNALQSNYGNQNTIMGSQAGIFITSSMNTIIGNNAGRNLTSDANTAVGSDALNAAQGAERNTAIGYGSLDTLSTGDKNTALGYKSGDAMNTGSHNITIGNEAGDNITSGSGNVVIGKADVSSATGNDQLSISSGDGDVTWLTGTSAGVVDIPGSLTVAGASVGGASSAHVIKTAGVNWYGSQQADIRLTSLPPYGVKAMTTFTFSTSGDYDKPIFFPFVAPKTGNLSRMNSYAHSGATGLNLLVAVYSDHNGYPASLLFKGTMDWSSGGNKTITSFTDASGNSVTPSLTKDTQYHVGWVRDDNGVAYTAYVSNGQYGPSSGLNLNMAEAYVGVSDTIGQYGGSSNVLATSYNSGSPDWDDFTYFNASVKPINFGIKYA